MHTILYHSSLNHQKKKKKKEYWLYLEKIIFFVFNAMNV